MTTKIVISALGADRPGIVDELSRFIYKNQLNIEDSRMTVLGGEFAVLLLVSGEKEAAESFMEKVPELEHSLNMRLLVKTTTASDANPNAIPYSVDVAALDHPGIVGNIAGFFSGRHFNIVNLQTERYAAAHTGSPMFSLRMTVGIPADTNIARLREDFMLTCDELNLDAELNIL